MIDKLLRAKTVVGVAAAVLLASGIAFATTDTGSRPAVSQDEVSTTSTSVSDSSTTTSVDETTSTTATSETTSTTVASGSSTTTTETGHPENHGACVSAAAHDTPPGPDHGKTVSSVAKSDCGKTSTTATTEADNENENEAPEQENEQNGSQSADHGNSGADHGSSGQD